MSNHNSESNSIDLMCHEVIIEDFIEPEPKLSQEDAAMTMKPLPSVTPTPLSTPISKRTSGLKRIKLDNSSEMNSKINLATDSIAWTSDHCIDPIHAILAPEIRWTIFKEFTQAELLSLRLVSRDWKSSIDSFLKVDVKIDGHGHAGHQTGSGSGCGALVTGTCGLNIKTCKLVSLQNPAHRRLFLNAQVPTEGVTVSGGISHVNFEQLIEQWGGNLTKLELCWRTTMKNLLFGSRKNSRTLTGIGNQIFPNLTTLKLEILTKPELGNTTSKRIHSNIEILTGFQYPSLVHFSMSFVGFRGLHVEYPFLVSHFLPFIQRHADKLGTLEVTLKYTSHVAYPPAHPRHILFCVPANLKTQYKNPYKATDCHLITTQLCRPSSRNEWSDWIEMLNDTRKLEVTITRRFLNWTIKHFDFFGSCVSHYSRFLRRLDLMNVTMYDGGSHRTVSQLDAKIFSVCEQLEHLSVYRAPIIFHEDEIDPTSELVNVDHLPVTLRNLVLDGLPVSSTEILAAVKNLENLISFQYFQSQIPRRNLLWTNGVNGEILEALAQHSQLRTIKVHLTTSSQQGQPDHWDRSQLELFETQLKELAEEFGWHTKGILPGYMNLYQIILQKDEKSLKFL